MIRVGNKGQPWQRPKPTKNESTYSRQCKKSTLSFYTVATWPVTVVPVPYTPEATPHMTPWGTCLFQVHKAHVDLLDKLPCTLQYPCENKKLVQDFMISMKTALFILNPSFNRQPIFTHPLVPLLKKKDHHPSLPIQKSLTSMQCWRGVSTKIASQRWTWCSLWTYYDGLSL